MNKLMNDVVDAILDKGAKLSISKRNGGLCVDLQTGAKSHGHLVEDGDRVFFEGRYGKREEVMDLNDVLWLVKGCLHGNDYMSPFWISVLSEEGILKVYTETKTYLK